MSRQVTMQLAKLLQLPSNCFEATLHISAVKGPILSTRCYVKGVDVPAEQVFELHEITPKAEPAPLDLDKMAANARHELAQFIQADADYDSLQIRESFRASRARLDSMRKRWAQEDAARAIFSDTLEKFLSSPEIKAFLDGLLDKSATYRPRYGNTGRPQ